MFKYFKLFNSHLDYEAAKKNLTLPNVSYCKDADDVHFNPSPDYSQVYLTFEALEDGTFTFTNPVNYSLDNGSTWTELAADTATPTVTVGSKIMWRAEITPSTTNPYGIGTFSSTSNFNVEGNPMSLLYGDNFKGQTDLTGKDWAFFQLFNNCSKLISAKNLSLPATTLAKGCYESMFGGCTSLITIPTLPATTLASRCYFRMFSGCTSLTAAPALPATALAENCYSAMFNGCTSLTTAPELLATTLTEGCYSAMFQGCTSLTTAPELPATTLASSCYGSMFGGCTSLTTAPTLPATTLASRCYGDMFYGCTSLTAAPELPATTLASYCYLTMFNGCTSLTTALALPATTLAYYCYSGMFKGCTSLTTAPALPATTLATYCYTQMFYGCTSLTTAPELPATTLTDGCYNQMFEDCKSLTTAPELPATTLTNKCYNQMFEGCKSLTTAPELPATELVGNCYQGMFWRCTSLNYIKAMFTTTPGTTYTNNWVYGVAASGTFVKNSAATWTTTGANGVPYGWTVHYDYSQDYLTFEALEDGTFQFTKAINYSVDGGTTWTELAANTDTPTVNAGNKIMWKGEMTPQEYNGVGKFSSTSNFNVEGNVMSLLYGDNFAGQTDLTGKDYAFYNLFYKCSKLINAENLSLPSETLAEHCYESMFEACTNLTTVPELPATTLARDCYTNMFINCTSLTTAPELPATTLAKKCYNQMFYGCTGLTTAPELPATDLVSGCYSSMFSGCTSLNYIKAMFTTTPSSTYTGSWISGVSSSGTFVKNNAATWDVTGDYGIPTGWTVVTE